MKGPLLQADLLLAAVLILLIAICDIGLAARTVEESLSKEEEVWLKAFPTTPMPDLLRKRLPTLKGLAARQFSEEARSGQLSPKSCRDAMVSCIIDTMLVDVVDSRHMGRGPGAQPHEYVHEKQLVTGSEIILPNLHGYNAPLTAFLPGSIIDHLPYGSKHLPAMLGLFGYTSQSNMSKNMVASLHECEAEAPKGQKWLCATSMEMLINFVVSVLPQASELVTSSDTVGSQEAVQVLNAKLRYDGQAPPVSCHSFAFPHALFFCHYIQGTKIYTITLQTKAGLISERTTICHALNAITRNLMPNSDEQDCHWIYGSHLLWIPS